MADSGVGGDGGGVADGVGSDVSGLGGDAVRDEIDLDSNYDEDDDENDEEEDVEDVEIGARNEEQNVEGEDDDDWLNEGLEGEDLDDDISAAQNSAPQGFAPNTALESSNAPHTAPKSSNALYADLE